MCYDTFDILVQVVDVQERQNSVLCNVRRSEVENGGERRQRRRGGSPADLQLCLDTETEPSGSRKKPASKR